MSYIYILELGDIKNVLFLCRLMKYIAIIPPTTKQSNKAKRTINPVVACQVSHELALAAAGATDGAK